MTRVLRRRILVLLVILNFGVLIALGVSLLQVRKERVGLQSENNEVSEKMILMQKKYKEEKARVEGLQRTQSGLEGQKRTLQNELTKLKEENASLRSREGASEKGLLGKIASLTARVEELSKQASEVRTAYDALRGECAQGKKESEKRLSKLAAENRGLEEKLTRQEQRLARCNADNAELSGLVDDLLAKYENKGVVNSILQKEPFTQMERAEVERLVQEYKEKKAKHSAERFEQGTSD